MKTLTPEMLAHIAQPVTTLASCIFITRQDGQSFALTDHDRNLVINSVTYLASAGFSGSAMTADSTMAVDNIDLVGLFNNSAITKADLQTGKFDFAKVKLFRVNWADLSMQDIKLRFGNFGEVVVTPQGSFVVELRGLSQLLTTETVKVYSPFCRADLGDTLCKVPIAPAAWQPNTAVTAGTLMDGRVVYVSQPSPPNDLRKLAVYQCINPGTTDSTAPTFDPTVGAQTFESGGSTVVWLSIAPYRGVATVASVGDPLRAFETTAPLLVRDQDGPAATALVTFLANTVNVVISASADGITTHLFTLANGEAPATAAADLAAQIVAAGIGLIATASGATTTVTKGAPTAGGWVAVAHADSSVAATSFADGYMEQGMVTWKTGTNAGLSMEIGAYTQAGAGDIVSLYLAMPYAIQVGDVFYYQPGCDKSRTTCTRKFQNIWNFRGEPDVPGLDALFNYPGAG